jgi:PST family polysaccharide transporter
MNLLKSLLKRDVFKQLSWYTLAQIVVQGVAFLSAIIVTRYLGPTNLGLYSFVQNYVGTLLTVGGGLDFYFTWKIAKSDNHFKDLQIFVGYKFSIYAFLSVIGIVLAWIILPRDIALMVSIMLALVAVQSLSIFSIYIIVTNRARLMSTIQIVTSVALLGIKVLLVFFKAPLYSFVIVSGIDLILTGVLVSIYLLKEPEWKNFFVGFKVPTLMNSVIFLYTIRLSILAIVFWQLLLRIDQVILATLSNAYTLGIYSAAVKIAEVPNFLAGVLSAALISRMAYISNRDDINSKKRLQKIMLTYLSVGVIITVSIIVFAPIAVHILYGTKFTDSIPVLRAYSLSIPGMFMNYFFLGIYGARDKQHHQVGIFGTALVVNIALVYLLTPIFGIIGTALATSVAYTVSAFGFYYNLK